MKKSKIFAKAVLAILAAATLLSFAGCGLSGRTYSSVNIPGSNVPYFSLTFKSGSKGTISVANATAPNDKKQAEQYKFTYKIVNKDKHTVNMSVFKSSGDIAWASESDFSDTSVSYMMRGGDQILLFSKNAKNDGLSGKAYSAGFLNKKKEFYGYTLVFENDENAKFTDSRKNNGKAIPASYKEDSAAGIFQFGFMDGEEFKFFNGTAGNDGIKFKTSLSSEVSLAPGAYNFPDFIAETYEKWNQRGKVYLASDDETNKRSVTEIKGFDEHGSENLYMSKSDDERKTSVSKVENVYDSEGRLLKAPLENREYSYDSEGRLLSKKERYGGIETYSYDSNGNYVISNTLTEESTTYDKNGRIIEATGYVGFTNNDKYKSKYTYNENGDLLTRYSYDESGNIIGQNVNIIYLYKNNSDGSKSVLRYLTSKIQYEKEIFDYDKEGALVYYYDGYFHFGPEIGGGNVSEHWYTYEHDKNGNVSYKKDEYKGEINDVGPDDLFTYDISKYDELSKSKEIWERTSTNPDNSTYRKPYSGTTEEWHEYNEKNKITHEKKLDKRTETEVNRYDDLQTTSESISTDEQWYEYNEKGSIIHRKESDSANSWNNGEYWYLYAYYDDGTVKTDISLK